MILDTERHAVAEAGRRMLADRLVAGTAGNVSVRVGDLVAVTPSAVGYAELTGAQVGVHQLDGTPVEAPLAPTTELPMHLSAYEITGAGAVVHTHSPAAAALSCLVDEVPLVHYYAAMFGGPPRVAAYATYGTVELAEAMARAMRGRSGCLLANHGALVTAVDLATALDRATHLEWLCDVALRVISAGRPPRLLTEVELAAAARRLAGYRPSPGPG
ncbi:MAG: class II aldolase/adducin family protein [Actinobacteria bacterium]|nr:class II aldolase/adducin family protein [Actinomycetota bacterium]